MEAAACILKQVWPFLNGPYNEIITTDNSVPVL